MAYREFYSFRLKCQSLTDGRNWNLFNSPDMLCTFISKLTMSISDRWNRRIQFTRKNQLREPDLADFINFVDKETELVNDPLYSREAVDQHTERKERERKSFSKRDRQFKMLAVQLEEDSKEKSLAKNTKDTVPCVMCAKIDDLEQCKVHLTKSVDARSKYLSTEKLLWMLETNISNPYGKELLSTSNLQSLQQKTSYVTAWISAEKENQARSCQ